jgi:hypothetical protein
MATLTATGTLAPSGAVLAPYGSAQPVVTHGQVLLFGSEDTTATASALLYWDSSRVIPDLDEVISQTVRLTQGAGIGFDSFSGDSGDIGSLRSGGTFATRDFTYASPPGQSATVVATATLSSATVEPLLVHKTPADKDASSQTIALQNALLLGSASGTVTTTGSYSSVLPVGVLGQTQESAYGGIDGTDAPPGLSASLPGDLKHSATVGEFTAHITVYAMMRSLIRKAVYSGVVAEDASSTSHPMP